MRVQDNTWLYEAVENSREVLPIFILDEHLIDKFGGLKDNKFAFIREALESMSQEIKNLWGDKVIVMKWKPEEIIPELVGKYNIECIYTNTTYGTYGKKRDEDIQKIVLNKWCKFESHKDFYLVEPWQVEQRKVFTPFYKLWLKYLEANIEETHILPDITQFTQLKTSEQTEAKDFIEQEKHPHFTMQFGKERFEKHILSHYDDVRNNLDKDGTSRLSPYLRFWVFSVRQILKQAIEVAPQEEWKHIPHSSYISEIAWREFWAHIYHYFPATRDEEFQEKRRHIAWSQDTEMFEKWCQWETGYPIIDAAMKQLNETNWMHGRARMIVASFLTKDMHIDWRLWEKYFKEKLLDYDEAVNLWNWQWSASVGADPKPLRIFNPILQSEKFDPEARYIKKYLPELEHESLKAIHNPLDNYLIYHTPIVDHKIETGRAREMYKSDSYESTR